MYIGKLLLIPNSTSSVITHFSITNIYGLESNTLFCGNTAIWIPMASAQDPNSMFDCEI